MRSFALALTACLACSHDRSGPSDPIFHRDCATPIALHCSQLAIVTARSPIATSSKPVGQLFARNGGFDAFEAPALLQHYVIDGSPPHFHATSNVLLLPDGASATTSDGTKWFAYVNGSPERFRAWDATNANVGDVALDRSAGANAGGIAAYQGLALVHHQDYGATDRLFMLDTTGAIGWVATGALATSAPGSYGCGFALAGDSLTTVPLDGRPRMQQAASGTAAPWPYDSHAVALASYDAPPYYAPLDAATLCDARLTLAFDDGRPPITRTYARDCPTLTDAHPAALLTTSFGAVMYFGNDAFALLDENANIVGAPVRLTLEGAEATIQIGAGGDYVVAIVDEFTPPDPVNSYETILACSAP